MERGLRRHEKNMASRARKSAKFIMDKLQKENSELKWLFEELREKNKVLEYKATHDSLTGLLNKGAMEKHISERIDSAKEDDNIGLFFIDLTNFKRINDEHGHHIGDSVLQRIAHQIKGTIRQEDTAAHYISRQGGDEFVVFFDNLSPRPELTNTLTPQERMDSIYERFTSAFNEFKSNPIDEDSSITLASIGFDVSIGRALWSPGISTDQLIHQADQDMFTNKTAQHDIGGSYR